jgi:murein DD-endopeptidase MepM/ murein hydrolase activator NlpD
VFVGFAGMLVAGLLVAFGPRLLPSREPVTVTAPVRGRWLGVNSPATKVPSHGIRAYGQAYAIDLVYEPVDGPARPEFGSGAAFRASGEYPAFGEPVLAMIDGIVVKASDWKRDHRARSNYPAMLYLMVEGAIRELGGPGFIVGNHIVTRGDDGVFALVAHLKQGSALVRPGERVAAGQVIAACGNSGNSTEPHVHAQLMDRASPLVGQGIPFAFDGHAVPADGEHLEV